MLIRPLFLAASLSSVALAQTQSPERASTLEITNGVVSVNDGTFNYQGVLTDNGAPANGMYSFSIEPYTSADGFDIAHELLFFSDPIPVVDGLFSLDIQMGGNASEARRFWREIGDEPIYLEIGVGLIKGGPYTTLGTRAKVGWSARAQYAGISESLRFPYSDTYIDPFGDPSTMLSLTSEFGGIVAEFRSANAADEPIVHIAGSDTFNSGFSFQSGALLVDSRDDEVAIRGEGTRYSVVGFHSEPSTLTGVSASVLGSVGFFSSPDIIAVWANNGPAGTSARLGVENYAGDFTGDVLIRNALRVEENVTRDFGSNEPAMVGPAAYGFVNSAGNVTNGTANLDAVWNAGSSTYRITLDGYTGIHSLLTTHVTVIDSIEPRIATTNGFGSYVEVTIWDLNSGNIRVQDNFTIVLFDPTTGSSVARLGIPGDADTFATQNPGYRIEPVVDPIPVIDESSPLEE